LFPAFSRECVNRSMIQAGRVPARGWRDQRNA
jgi:hypothetical protein